MSGHAPISEAAPRRRARRKQHALAIAPAKPGDYAAALRFLTSVFRSPSPAEFRATVEDPAHEPGDRLLIKQGHDVLGHALVAHRKIRLGRSVVPAASLQDLATAPELREQGFGALLLRRAERQMIDEQNVLGLLATTTPRFFHRLGWTPCGRHNQYAASVHKILSVLAAKGLYPKIRKPLDIRPLRRMEIAKVANVYQVNVAERHGPFERSEAHWHWLINRGAYDEFLVAIDRRDKRRSADRTAEIVGYAILKGNRIVELFTLPDHGKAGVQLLSRACGEAIERGVDTLYIDLAPQNRLARILKAAGALPPTENRQDDVLMAKILCPERMLRLLGCEFVGRATAADLPMPLDFGLAVGQQKYQISIDSHRTGNGHSPHSIDIATGSMGRSYLRIDPSRLAELFLGQIDWNSPGDIEFSTKLAEQAATALFPRHTLWRPPLDDVPTEK